jgi:hypothetical protein
LDSAKRRRAAMHFGGVTIECLLKSIIKRPVKPLPFRHGDIRAYLSWGLGTGALKPVDM